MARYGRSLFPMNRYLEDLLAESEDSGFSVYDINFVKTDTGAFELLCMESGLAGNTWYMTDYSPESSGNDGFADRLGTDSRIFIDNRIHLTSDITVNGNCLIRAETLPENRPTDTDDERAHRTLLWLGKDNYGRVKGTRLFCIGAGGTMNPFITQAMHQGFEHFVIIDSDSLDASNLNRFYGGGHNDIGKNKAAVMKEIVTGFTSRADITVYENDFPGNDCWNDIAGSDIVVCGVDNVHTRYMAQLYARAFTKPLFDMGSGIFVSGAAGSGAGFTVDEMGGQVKVSLPEGACLMCMGLSPGEIRDRRRMEMERRSGYINGTEVTPPGVITLNSVIASLCLTLVRDYITGKEITDNIYLYDELSHTMKHRRIGKNADCPLCGD